MLSGEEVGYKPVLCIFLFLLPVLSHILIHKPSASKSVSVCRGVTTFLVEETVNKRHIRGQIKKIEEQRNERKKVTKSVRAARYFCTIHLWLWRKVNKTNFSLRTM